MKNEKMLRVNEERIILQATKRRKANWIGHTLSRNCFLKHVIEGKVEWPGRRERRRKQLLYEIKKTRRCWKLNEEALDRTL
jgi:hypothetical protein